MIDLIFSEVNVIIPVSVLRSIRILRVARVLRFLRYITIIQRIISMQFSSFIYICLLLILMIILYSLIGGQIYKDLTILNKRIDFRQSFDSYFYAFLTVFQLITVENWTDIEMVLLNSNISYLTTFFYLTSLIFLGNYVLLNLFLGILVDGFTAYKQDNNQNSNFRELPLSYHLSKKSNENKEIVLFYFETENFDKKNLRKNKVIMNYKGIDCNSSLFIFDKSNFVRKNIYNLVSSNAFENFILLIITLSSVKLAVDSYFDDNDIEEKNISEIIDVIFNLIFIIEAMMKIISFGFFLDRGSYLRDYWSQMDFFIVFISFFDMCMTSIDISIMKVYSCFYLKNIFSDFQIVSNIKKFADNFS